MNKATSIILSLFLAVTLSAQSADSSKFASLGLKLSEYYDAMKGESIPVQKAECDFLIESVSDPALRQFIAQDIYDHYLNSPVMGSENIAVHVFDKWFAPGEVAMFSEKAFADARTHAEFNRQSLIGEKAPAIELNDIHGEQITLFDPKFPMKMFTVLYFYDTDCPKCSLETNQLNALLSDIDYPVHFYGIYVGDNKEAWSDYVKSQFSHPSTVASSTSDAPALSHLWDPTFSSDFQRKFGVTKTPRMFLVGPDGVILGRGLDSEALAVMLNGLFAEKKLEYGTRESETLFDGIFFMSSSRPSAGEVKGIADYIHDRTLALGDTLMFRQMAGDYLYYISSHAGEGFKEGMRYHIDRNILSTSGVWTTPDDSLKVVGFAQIMSDLLAKAAPGTEVPDIKVPGELYTWRGEKNVCMRLGKLKKDINIIIFYAEGCEVCAEEKSAARSLLQGGSDLPDTHWTASSVLQSSQQDVRDINVFMVNVDRMMTENPALATRLMDSFDLSSLPYIIITDARGIVLRRYVSLLS